jgi:hypothetical protein
MSSLLKNSNIKKKDMNHRWAESQQHLKMFKGKSAADWLYFNNSFIRIANSKGVGEELTKGTVNGKPALEYYSQMNFNQLQLLVSTTNKHFSAQRTSEEKLMIELIKAHPFVAYTVLGLKMPFNKNVFKDKAVNGEIIYTDNPAAEAHFVTEYVPRYQDEVFAKQYYRTWPMHLLVDELNGVQISTFDIMCAAGRLADARIASKSFNYEEIQAVISANSKLTSSDPNYVIGFANEKDAMESIRMKVGIDAPQIWDKYKTEEKHLQSELLKGEGHFSERRKLLGGLFTTYFNPTDAHRVKVQTDGNKFFEAYQITSHHYINLGADNADGFLKEAKSILLNKGDDVNEHLIRVREALQMYACVCYLNHQLEKLRKKPDEIDMDPNIIEYNSWDKTSDEIIAASIHEVVDYSVRLDVIVGSFSGTSKRFQTVVDALNHKSKHERSITSFLETLHNVDCSKAGQQSLEEESSEIDTKDKKRKQDNVYPAGSCINHPKSTTHTTEQCQGASKKVKVKANAAATTAAGSKEGQKHCDFCAKTRPSSMNTHWTKNCFFDPKSSNFKPKKDKPVKALNSVSVTKEEIGDLFSAAISELLNGKAGNDNCKLKAKPELKNVITWLLDSASNKTIIPTHLSHVLSNIRKTQGRVEFGDGKTLPVHGSGELGILNNIIVCDCKYPLLSTPQLCNDLKLHVYHYDNLALILKPSVDSYSNKITFKILAKATLNEDNLYVIEDLSEFESEKKAISNLQIVNRKYTNKQIKEGSCKHNNLKSLRNNMNLLMWDHVRLGHTSESLLKHNINQQSVLGLGLSTDEVSKLTLPACDTCMKARMKAFPMYPSLSEVIYEAFESILTDWVPMGTRSIRGFNGLILFVDKQSDVLFTYPAISSSEWLDKLETLIADYQHVVKTNGKPISIKFLNSDYASELHSHKANKFRAKHGDIRLHNSAPYKHEQNEMESRVGPFFVMVRSAMSYNNAPANYWCYASEYTTVTRNHLCKMGEKLPRLEILTKFKCDVSSFVPFFATGWAHVSEEERKRLQLGTDKHLKDRAREVRMLGYPMPYTIPDKTQTRIFSKNSYICLDVRANTSFIRHDCYFMHTPAQNDLLSAEVEKRSLEPQPLLPDGETSESLNEAYDKLFKANEEINNPPEEENNSFQKTSGPTNPEQTGTKLPATTADKVASICWKDRLRQKNNKINENNNDKAKEQPLQTRFVSKSRIKPISAAAKSLQQRIREIKNATVATDLKRAIEKNEKLSTKQSSMLQKLRSKIKHSAMIAKAKKKKLEHSENSEPTTLEQALTGAESEQWWEAFNLEMDRLTARNTWIILGDEIQLTETTGEVIKPIKSKFVFRKSVKQDGSTKFRCRLVACGYSQIPEKDYDETFAPTAKYRSLCTILHLAATYGWHIAGIDVENAFIESEIDKEIYMKLPTDVFGDKITGKPIRVKLMKSLYGLKQAGELWYQKLNQIFTDMEFTRLAHDICVFKYRDASTGNIVIILCYVDDILFIGNNESLINESIEKVMSKVTKITQGEVKRFIGVDLKRDLTNHTITLSQKPYIKKFCNEHGSKEESTLLPTDIPMPHTLDFSAVKEPTGIEPIRDVVGGARYLADRTRPDLLTAVGLLGSAANNPSSTHLRGVRYLVRYLEGTCDSHELVLGGGDKTDVTLFGYVDASHLPNGDSKPRLGFCFFLNLHSGSIYARSFKGTSVSHSSCESEIDAIDEAIKSAIWLRGFLDELGFAQTQPTVLHTDSQSAKTLSDSYNIGNKSAHITVRLNFIHEQIKRKVIELKFINTENQVADVLTKLLPMDQHKTFTKVLLTGHGGKPPTVTLKSKLSAIRLALKKKMSEPAKPKNITHETKMEE